MPAGPCCCSVGLAFVASGHQEVAPRSHARALLSFGTGVKCLWAPLRTLTPLQMQGWPGLQQRLVFFWALKHRVRSSGVLVTSSLGWRHLSLQPQQVPHRSPVSWPPVGDAAPWSCLPCPLCLSIPAPGQAAPGQAQPLKRASCCLGNASLATKILHRAFVSPSRMPRLT